MTKRKALEQELEETCKRIRVLNGEIDERVVERNNLNKSRLEIMQSINEALQEEIAQAGSGGK